MTVAPSRAAALAAIRAADSAYASAWATVYREVCLEYEVLASPLATASKAQVLASARAAFQDAALAGASPSDARTAAKLAVGSW